MAEDPYQVLGVARTASAEEIRRAYRTLAKKSHPDLHPGDKAAEARFKRVNAANDLLSDPAKRGQFDRGEIDAEGQPVPERSYYRDYAQNDTGGRYRSGGMEDIDIESLFGAFARGQAGREETGRPRAGRDRSYRLEVPFQDAVNGAVQTLTLPDGATLEVRIPAGIDDGQVLRLRGQGEPGVRGGPDGDALIEISVLPHRLFRRNGADLEVDLPVTFREAVLGARVEVPTPGGAVMLSVPARSDSGTRLRLRGRGVAAHGGTAAGDLYVVLRVVTGPVDAELERFLEGWPQAGFDPRADMKGV